MVNNTSIIERMENDLTALSHGISVKNEYRIIHAIIITWITAMQHLSGVLKKGLVLQCVTCYVILKSISLILVVSQGLAYPQSLPFPRTHMIHI